MVDLPELPNWEKLDWIWIQGINIACDQYKLSCTILFSSPASNFTARWEILFVRGTGYSQSSMLFEIVHGRLYCLPHRSGRSLSFFWKFTLMAPSFVLPSFSWNVLWDITSFYGWLRLLKWNQSIDPSFSTLFIKTQQSIKQRNSFANDKEAVNWPKKASNVPTQGSLVYYNLCNYYQNTIVLFSKSLLSKVCMLFWIPNISNSRLRDLNNY